MKIQRRKGMEHFQYQTLRDVLKVEGDRFKEFVEKYREVQVQTSRKKMVKTQYAMGQGTGEMNMMFMGTESQSRRRSQEAGFLRMLPSFFIWRVCVFIFVHHAWYYPYILSV